MSTTLAAPATPSDFFLSHYRSHSDSTNSKSYNYDKMVQPRLFMEGATIQNSSRKRAYHQVFPDSNDSISSKSKKAKSAPSSPVIFLDSPGKKLPGTPHTTPVKLPELPLTPPSNSITSPELYKMDGPQALKSPLASPRPHSMVNTPPDSQNTSPKQFSRILKSSYKPSTQ
ncbi:unnamed protein product [Ambrosiozyma monospora]|uniref:Unnamed protein product n=1 Tax=Ambrosiozyma monospora TaxID=43982 RepID=A0ACB5T5Q4_AMBMO|nr:unnamed protein product [Ambrosiozyma monospora]